jgi:nicotinamidase-related amidase
MRKIGLWLVFLIMISALLQGMPGSKDKADSEKVTQGMKPALLVIDIQNVYLPMMDQAEKERALKVINYVIDMFRSKGFAVIRVYHTDLKYGPKPDSTAFQFPESVTIKPDDPMIIKNYGNAFKKTGLEEKLRESGINTLFLCGLSSVGCVISTFFGALDLDFEAFLLKDALIGPDSKHTKWIEEMFNALGYRALNIMLENARK